MRPYTAADAYTAPCRTGQRFLQTAAVFDFRTDNNFCRNQSGNQVGTLTQIVLGNKCFQQLGCVFRQLVFWKKVATADRTSTADTDHVYASIGAIQSGCHHIRVTAIAGDNLLLLYTSQIGNLVTQTRGLLILKFGRILLTKMNQRFNQGISFAYQYR